VDSRVLEKKKNTQKTPQKPKKPQTTNPHQNAEDRGAGSEKKKWRRNARRVSEVRIGAEKFDRTL